MGVASLLACSGLALAELILQLCAVATHSTESKALFLTLLALVMGPLILVNVASAVLVTRTQDFTGKPCGRIVCIGFHSVQLGIVWRALKLLILYEPQDWTDYSGMRLFQSGFQSLPFSIVLAYSMIVNGSTSALDVVTLVFTLISASAAFTAYRTCDIFKDDDDSGATSIRTCFTKLRIPLAVVFLTLSSLLVLFARCASIVLFAVAQPYWIALPLGLHFIVHLCLEICKLSCNTESLASKIIIAIYIAAVNIYDMVGRGYQGVKCSYVFYYTIMLVENLALSFYWMLTAEHGEQSKLLAVLMILLCFIVGLIVKFSSCGRVFNVESDILSDAFNNPELSSIKDKDQIKGFNNSRHEDNVDFHNDVIREIYDDSVPRRNPITLTLQNDVTNSPRATHKHSDQHRHLSPVSSPAHVQRNRKHFHDNPAFVQSQGNLSHSSHVTSSTQKRSRDSNKLSKGSKDTGNSSDKERTLGAKGKASRRNSKYKESDARSSQRTLSDKRPSRIDVHSPETQTVSRPPKPTIIVSDTSKHSLPRDSATRPKERGTSNGNLTLASSHSKYSRNTHTMSGTLNGSENYGYNGFDDPFRERKQLDKSKSRTSKNRRNRQHRRHHAHQTFPHSYRDSNVADMDFSLDSSEMYPSATSDTSSVSTYTDHQNRHWQNSRQRENRRKRAMQMYDGYSTDVSNSDYLSFNDYSMEDSSSWTESSESSSDGAATWPPSHTTNLLKMYNIPDRESSTENILHWLDSMDPGSSAHETSFSTLHEPSVASDTDLSMTAMQTFEVKKEKKRFRKLIPKPKGLLLKFSSLNYKGKEKNRPYPLKKITHVDKGAIKNDVHAYDNNDVFVHSSEHVAYDVSSNPVEPPLPGMPLPVDIVQESIV